MSSSLSRCKGVHTAHKTLQHCGGIGDVQCGWRSACLQEMEAWATLGRAALKKESGLHPFKKTQRAFDDTLYQLSPRSARQACSAAPRQA